MNSSELESSESEIVEPDQLWLYQLPWLITDYIMSKMERSDLMNLRLTCRTLKSWAERPKHLKTLRIHIDSKASMKQLLKKSQTHWNNFYLQWDLRKTKMISLFSTTFGENIHILEFSNFGNCSGIVEVVLGCPNLQILIIQQLDCSYITRLPLQKKLGLSRCLGNLEQLGIFELLCKDDTDADSFFNQILSKCASSLQSVAVPVIIFPKRSSLYRKYDVDRVVPNDVFVVRPMIQLLENSAHKLQTIVVKPESRSLLSDSALFCLTLLCYNKRINLTYGTMTGEPLNLGRLNYELSPHPTMAEIASKIMTAMAATTDLLLNNEFGNLRKLIIQFKLFHIDEDVFVVQNFPKLKALCMDFKIRGNNNANNLNNGNGNGGAGAGGGGGDGNNGGGGDGNNGGGGDGNNGGGGGGADVLREIKVRRMNMFVQGMLEVARPSVKSFKVQNHDQVEQWIDISATKLVNTFTNVKDISVIHWNGDDEAFTILWDGLRLLEKVEIRNCPNLGDKGILGKNLIRPKILDLKYLKELYLSKTGRITDLSYILAFRHMRLRIFHHEPLYSSDVTRSGYSSLADGDFNHFIRFFTGSTNYFGCSRRRDLKEYLDRFDNLIEPHRDICLAEFVINRCYDRIFPTFSKD